MIHSALSDEELFVSFSWICDKMHPVINELFFVVFISIFFPFELDPQMRNYSLDQIPHSWDVSPVFRL